MKSPLADVRTWRIPRRILRETITVLQRSGAAGHEAFVLWGGTVEGDTLTFGSAVAPEQTGHQTDNGLLVTVDGHALFAVNRDLYQRGEILAGQVHSHPTTAYHSSTDDHFPLVTLQGALSVVIPDFAVHAPADIAHWAWYRLVGTATWNELTRNHHVEIFEG